VADWSAILSLDQRRPAAQKAKEAGYAPGLERPTAMEQALEDGSFSTGPRDLNLGQPLRLERRGNPGTLTAALAQQEIGWGRHSDCTAPVSITT
jgi:hypothetical protein